MKTPIFLKKFSHWINYQPPGSLSSRGWRLFKKEFKERAPIRYWITHDLRHKFLLPVKWKFDNVSNWVRYRTYDRYHIVDIGLPPAYYDNETRMLHSSFQILKDFVEIELAWRTYCFSEEFKNRPLLEKLLGYKYFRKSPNKKYGLEHLDWAATLDDPALPPQERCDHQAVSAREIKALYIWWTETRPKREEKTAPAVSDQGLGVLSFLDSDFDHNAEDYKNFSKTMEENQKLKESWDREDEEMFIRLVKVRRDLWS